MPNVSVLIPYGYTTDWQYRLFEYTVERWQKSFPHWEIVIGDGGHPFNRSRARNDAARKANGDVYVVCDADTTFLFASDMEVLALTAEVEGHWFLPSSYLQTTEDWTRRTVGGARVDLHVDFSREYHDQPGGWRICNADAYHAAYGFDEHFQGWGYEDTAFASVMTALQGEPIRTASALHLWHPTNRKDRQEQPHIFDNLRRYELYRSAERKGVHAMEALLQELNP